MEDQNSEIEALELKCAVLQLRNERLERRLEHVKEEHLKDLDRMSVPPRPWAPEARPRLDFFPLYSELITRAEKAEGMVSRLKQQLQEINAKLAENWQTEQQLKNEELNRVRHNQRSLCLNTLGQLWKRTISEGESRGIQLSIDAIRAISQPQPSEQQDSTK